MIKNFIKNLILLPSKKKLIKMMRGYRYLKNKNELNIPSLIANELSKKKFNFNDTININEINIDLELSIRQFLTDYMLNKLLIKELLCSFGDKNYKIFFYSSNYLFK